MIWRLMASVLVVSDAGSIALVTDHTDWSSQAECLQIIDSMYSTPPTSVLIGGVKVTTTTKAQCVPVGFVPPVVTVERRAPSIPPPFGFFFDQYGNQIQERRQ